MVPNLLQSSPSSRPSQPTKNEFWDKYKFIPIREAHLEWMAYACGREMPPIEELYGNAMVDAETYIPLGFCAGWFQPNGVVQIQASFGEYFRQHPKDILAAMAPTFRQVREHGVRSVYAIADEEVKGSIDLIEWFDGKKTGHRSTEPPIGDEYEIDCYGPRISKVIEQRG